VYQSKYSGGFATCGGSIIFVVADFAACGSKISNNKNAYELPKAVRGQEERPE